jgi:signal transduction histidine kinase
MRERLKLIGGELLVESSIGVGTTIFVRIALEAAQAVA